ncbi:SDR family oxidoreductase [Sediminicola sp. 1XM1-17]|uniref:SDR family oxidoreductase n=1 Tax=Sediminicola sp. 1XM1-17 TaxID=3127702 RepID=UPI003077E517
MENVLIAGANGTTGKIIVNLLKESQYFRPIAMVRKKDQMEQFESMGVKTILGDLEKDLVHTMDDIDKVIFAAGSGGKKVVEVDQEGAKRLIDVAKMAHIKKFVMLSSIGADQPEKADKLQDYLKAKQNADEHLRHSGLNYTIVRPGALKNDKAVGKIDLAKSLEHKDGDISRQDVAQTLVRVLHDTTANAATFEILEGDTLIGEAVKKVSVAEAK